MFRVFTKTTFLVHRRFAGLPLEAIVENLNPVLRGWGAYFRFGNSGQKFDVIDAYVNQRLAMLASVKHGLQDGTGASASTTGGDQPRRVYRFSGKVRPTTAYASR